MGKRFWLMWVKQCLLGLTVAFCAGVLYDRVFTPDYDRNALSAGLIATALYVVAGLVLAGISFVTSLLYLKLFAISDLSGGILDEFRALKMPPPRSHHSKNFDYLAALADDGREDPDDRVKAALIFGGYKATMGTGIVRTLTLRKAIDDAILRYAQEAPTTKQPQVDLI